MAQYTPPVAPQKPRKNPERLILWQSLKMEAENVAAATRLRLDSVLQERERVMHRLGSAVAQFKRKYESIDKNSAEWRKKDSYRDAWNKAKNDCKEKQVGYTKQILMIKSSADSQIHKIYKRFK